MNTSIETLLERVGQRDGAAFRALYEAMAPKLLGVALRILKRREGAEDVVQDVFVKLWNGQAVFNAALGSGPAFLATIARNHHLGATGFEDARQRKDVADVVFHHQNRPALEGVVALARRLQHATRIGRQPRLHLVQKQRDLIQQPLW